MRFTARHHFEAPPEAVAAVLTDPAFHVGLHLPDLSRPEVVEHSSGDDTDLLRLRYEFTGSLDPVARRLLGSRRLSWIQEVQINRATGRGTLSFGAEADARRLHGSARFTLDADDGGTTRQITGELVVAVPGVGGMAERRIVPGLTRRLDIEAAALQRRLASGPAEGSRPPT